MAHKSLSEQIACKCVHFNGMQNKQCDAGVAYGSVKDESRQGFVRFPCWREGEAVPCEKRHFPTAEEVAAEVAERDAHWEQLKKALTAAQADAQSHGFKEGSGGRGSVKCPCCDGGTLYYSVASYNGHMHGKCSTEGCMSWMQ